MDYNTLTLATAIKDGIERYNKEVDKIDSILESSNNNNLIELYIEGRIFDTPLNKEISIKINGVLMKLTKDYLIKYRRILIKKILTLEKQFEKL